MTICIPEAGNSYSCRDYQKLKPLAALVMETDSADLSRSLLALGLYNYIEPAETMSAARK